MYYILCIIYITCDGVVGGRENIEGQEQKQMRRGGRSQCWARLSPTIWGIFKTFFWKNYQKSMFTGVQCPSTPYLLSNSQNNIHQMLTDCMVHVQETELSCQQLKAKANFAIVKMRCNL